MIASINRGIFTPIKTTAPSLIVGSPTIDAPTLQSWLPVDALQRLPALWKRARDAYCKQRYCAEQRGVGWKFIFASWWFVWSSSGRWEQRGQGLGRYQMARLGPDEGAYEPSNVRIITHEENLRERSHERHRAACRRRSKRASWLAAVRAVASSPEGRKQRSESGLRREAAKRAAREASTP
jgi:hypothetical protein